MIIYTNNKPKQSKKQRIASTELKKVQRSARKSLKSSKREYQPVLPQAYRENNIPSLGINSGNTLKKDKKEYTGDLIIGICQTHKSNAVPIINKEHAEDIAKMRR